MKIEKNKVVALSYTLTVDGTVADKAGSDKPLEYIQGMGMLLPKFEAAVEGKEPGESFAFTLTPEEGYGEYNPEYKVQIPVSAFAIDGKIHDELLKVGKTLPMLNSEGQVIQGTVAAVSAETVTMDFNHPMAGKTLDFTGKVESVRGATEKELKEGLHGEFLPPEEGCHCGGGGCHCDSEGGHGCGCHSEEGHRCGCHSDGGHEEGCCHEGHHKEGGCCKNN